MDKVVTVLLLSGLLPAFSLKEFSLARFSDTVVYANNSVIDIRLIGEGTVTDGGALECHTDDINCCRSTDGMAGGEWYDPDGNVIIAGNQIGSDNGLYRTRGHMVIRLNRRGDAGGLLTGVYRCEIPGAGGVTITRYITLTSRVGLCANLPPLSNGNITYTPPRVLSTTLPDGQRFQGTITTYSCSSGYQLVEGSTQRACINGTWNGTQPSCELSGTISTSNPLTSTPTATTLVPTTPPQTTTNSFATQTNTDVSTQSTTSQPSTTTPPQTDSSTHPPDITYRSTTSTNTQSSTSDATTQSTTQQAIDCGPLTSPVNGQVNTSSGTTFGSTATYTCDTGYTLVGVTSRTCESTGSWSFTAPHCQVINCGPLTAPANGQVDTSSGTTFGSTATYACNAITRTCGPDGAWTPQEPNCANSLSSVGNGPSEVNGIVGGVIAVVWFLISILIIALLVVYILYLKRQPKGQDSQDKGQQRSAAQYETVGGGSAPEYEVMEGGGAEYEEIDKVKEKMGQSHPPKGDYELTQCSAYGPVNTDM